MGKDLRGKDLGKGLRQRQDKKYIARFSSRTGKRPEKAFDKLSDAKIWLNDQRYLDRHQNIATSNDMTVDTWFWYWVENIKKPIIRSSTYRLYADRYRLSICPAIGKMLLSDVKPLHCQEFINQAQKIESASTVTTERMIMRHFFTAAVDNGLITQSPITRWVKVAKRSKGERRVFTATEQQKFVEYITENDYLYADHFIFILETGLRIGELMGLKWSDVDFRKRAINISRTLYYRSETSSYEEHEPKTASGYRIIPLTQTAYEIICKRKNAKILSQYVFTNSNAQIIRRSGFNQSLERVCKKIGIEPISPHSLRHSFATRCIENGMRPKTLQKILGHSNISMTMDLYVHATEDSLFDEMQSVEQKIKNGEKMA